MLGKNKVELDRRDQVVLFTPDGSKKRFCEILDVLEVKEDSIVTKSHSGGNFAGHVLPLADAEIYNSPDGLVYAFNVSKEYLQETKHLAEVEINTIVEQAFLYAGRNVPTGKTSGLTWVIIGILGLFALIGMFK